MRFLYKTLLYLAFAIEIIKADLNSFTASVEQCLKEFPITEGEMIRFFEEKDVQFGETFKCHMKCVLEKEHIFKNGTMDVDGFIKHSLEMATLKGREDEVQKIAEECKGENGVNDCDTAFKLGKCLCAHHTIFVH